MHTGAAGGGTERVLRHRRRGVAVQDRRHRAAAQEAARDQTAEGEPVVGAVRGVPRGETEAEDVRGRRRGQAPAADRFGPARRRTAGRRLVVHVGVAHQERLAPEGRDIQHAQAPEAVQLVSRGTTVRATPNGQAVADRKVPGKRFQRTSETGHLGRVG